MQQNQNREYYYEEEQGITLGEFFGVLFGRKLLLLIVTCALFLVSMIVILIYNGRTSTYQGMYSYYVTGLSDGKYIDGSRFDVRDLVTLEKLNEYKAEHEELKNLDMSSIYYNGVIESLKYETIYKKNESKLNDNDNDYIVDKTGYKIILTKKALSLKEAQVLTTAIAEEANFISQEIVDAADYTQYLTLFTQSNIYDYQINYLEEQYKLIYGKYTNLISQYGDVVLKSGLRLSDVQLNMQEYFQNISFDSLRNEVNYNGYVKDYTDYELQLEKQIESLNREKAVDVKKKTELEEQRDKILTAASLSQLQTLELSQYHEEIIKLSNRIFDIDEEIELLEKKLDNKDRETTDADYKAQLDAFKIKLQNHYEKLEEMTANYTSIEKEIVKKYSLVYYDSNSIVEKVNGISLLKFLIIALLASFAVGLVVNLCLDGKKLTRKYKLAHKDDDK